MNFFEIVKTEAHKMPIGEKVMNFDMKEMPENWRVQLNHLRSYFRDNLRRRVEVTLNHATGELTLCKLFLTGLEDEVPAPEPEVVVKPEEEDVEIVEEPSSASFLDRFRLKPDDEQE